MLNIFFYLVMWSPMIALGFWFFMLLRHKKAILALPYLTMPAITPVYIVLDQNVFVEIFGCGCVPIAQTNRLGIDFNANDLRNLVYSVLVPINIGLALWLCRKLSSKLWRAVYVLTVAACNLLLAVAICNTMMWN